MSINLGKQVISAQAASRHDLNEQILIAMKLRQDAHDMSASASNIQGQASLANGIAQQRATYQDAAVQGTMACQSFTEAGTIVGGEILGHVTEGVINNSKSAKLSQTNLDRAELLQKKLDGVKTSDLMLQRTVNGGSREEGTESVPMGASKATSTQKPQTASDEKIAELDLKLTDKGEMRKFADFSDEEKAAFNAAVEKPTSPTAIALRKQVRDAVKLYRSQTENTSKGASSKGQMMKDIVRAGNSTARGALDMQMASEKTTKGDLELMNKQQGLIETMTASISKQDQDVASGFSTFIHDLDADLQTLGDANRA